MNLAKAHAKARMAVKRREEEIEQDELESGELNLVPYLDIATNLLLFLLASLSSGVLFGHINTTLPDHAPAGAVGDNDPTKSPDEQPLQLVVTITSSEIRLWSVSRLEGTLSEPKARIPAQPPGSADAYAYDYGKLNEAMLEIVKRRWPDPASRPDSTKQVILQADANIVYEVVIAVMDHTREVPVDPENPSKPDAGLELFPSIHFSTGFQ
jgi:biopolymer transport protein TolR